MNVLRLLVEQVLGDELWRSDLAGVLLEVDGLTHFVRGRELMGAVFDSLALVPGISLVHAEDRAVITLNGTDSIQTALIFRQSDRTFLGFALGANAEAYSSGPTTFGIADAVGQVPRLAGPS